MQANKAHLDAIASMLGVEFKGNPTTEKMLKVIHEELVALHVTIVRLVPGVSRSGGVEGCRSRIVALEKLAKTSRFRPPRH